ncbi:YajQ family cyclic di-GMP-binding protein [Simiduia sp. 21SJ11W-1]|uniref:YajQ family cyclic di-GMP-binding protein n=1 Tax=Simiduia sp. 21SJ11W-1 TaxID=2909669 RepID=UPI00209CD30B|nr:YajQ family cyclic di-GMP-binding protein [Simiduia sp. 21SJ11W-1]UTA48894.1 YajQ family cyclic di-GMP-binding protein [Simiduia sp. 21SJ11W-1]
MPSFDIVSDVDKQVLTNCVDQATRIVTNRFDFKGVDATFERQDYAVTLVAEAEFQVMQMLEILQGALHKAGVDISCLDVGAPAMSGKQTRMVVTVRTGVETELAKKIVKMIKDKKLKVQAQIQGEQVRVTGKKRDDLQSVIALLRTADTGMPLQFENFRD